MARRYAYWVTLLEEMETLWEIYEGGREGGGMVMESEGMMGGGG